MGTTRQRLMLETIELDGGAGFIWRMETIGLGQAGSTQSTEVFPTEERAATELRNAVTLVLDEKLDVGPSGIHPMRGLPILTPGKRVRRKAPYPTAEAEAEREAANTPGGAS